MVTVGWTDGQPNGQGALVGVCEGGGSIIAWSLWEPEVRRRRLTKQSRCDNVRDVAVVS